MFYALVDSSGVAGAFGILAHMGVKYPGLKFMEKNQYARGTEKN